MFLNFTSFHFHFLLSFGFFYTFLLIFTFADYDVDGGRDLDIFDINEGMKKEENIFSFLVNL